MGQKFLLKLALIIHCQLFIRFCRKRPQATSNLTGIHWMHSRHRPDHLISCSTHWKQTWQSRSLCESGFLSVIRDHAVSFIGAYSNQLEIFNKGYSYMLFEFYMSIRCRDILLACRRTVKRANKYWQARNRRDATLDSATCKQAIISLQ